MKSASIGANATIVCGVTIGEYAFIGGGTLINKDVKPHALMVGVPAKQIGWVDFKGKKINFLNNEFEDEIAYYKLFDDNIKIIKK